MTWTVHPARQAPEKLLLVAAVCALTCGAVVLSLGSVLLAAIALIVLVVAISPFLLPTSYELTDAQVAEKRFGLTRRRALVDVARVDVGEDRVLLSPFSQPRWLDRYRGLLVMTLPSNHDSVVAQLREIVQ